LEAASASPYFWADEPQIFRWLLGERLSARWVPTTMSEARRGDLGSHAFVLDSVELAVPMVQAFPATDVLFLDLEARLPISSAQAYAVGRLLDGSLPEGAAVLVFNNDLDWVVLFVNVASGTRLKAIVA